MAAAGVLVIFVPAVIVTAMVVTVMGVLVLDSARIVGGQSPIRMRMIMPMAMRALDGDGQNHTCQQRQRQLAPIVGMKLDLRQQITKGNADEESARERQRCSNEQVSRLRLGGNTQTKQDGPKWTHHSKESVDDTPTSRRPASGSHQGRDRKSIEWFMQENRQKHTEGDEANGSLAVGLRHHGGTQHNTIEQSMHSKTEESADPTDSPRGTIGLMGVAVIVMMVVTRRVFILVMMDVKETQEKEHDQQAAEHPARHRDDGVQVLGRVREEVQEGNAEH